MTTYAQITNGQIVREAPAPTAPGYGPDGAWHDYTKPAEVAAYLTAGGWVAITEPATVKPADTATTYYAREVSIVAGAPVATWVAKAKTVEQQAAEAEAAARAQQQTNLREAVAQIITIRDAAQGDIATANTAKTQAQAVSAALATQSTQIAAWTPKVTYTASDLTAIRDQIKTLTDRQKQIADALAASYAYRAANDSAVVTIYNAVLWLARQVTGKILD